jgi:hypothetical protein
MVFSWPKTAKKLEIFLKAPVRSSPALNLVAAKVFFGFLRYLPVIKIPRSAIYKSADSSHFLLCFLDAVIRACLTGGVVPVMGFTLMAALTVRLPDDKHRRLKALAASRGTPLNRLIDEMTAVMLAEFDAETRFRLRASQGAAEKPRAWPCWTRRCTWQNKCRVCRDFYPEDWQIKNPASD